MDSNSKLDLGLLLREIFRQKLFIAIAFSLISVSIVIVGNNWPKQYSSSTTIFVEEENILGPLMQGAAVQTEVIDRSAIAREIIFGRNFMHKLIKRVYELDDNTEMDPAKQELVSNDIKRRLNISNVRSNLIKIEYSDSDPDRVFKIISNVAELYIQESLASKAQESTDAFEFIDKQAAEYKEKLQKAEAELKKFRSENVDAQPGMSEGIGRRSAELNTRKEQIMQELKEAKIRKNSLERQLSGEAIASTAFSRSEQYKARIAELQSQLDTLRLSYHETYPDIVHLKSQIEDLREAVATVESEARDDSKAKVIDERVLSNPVYQQLQRDLYDTNTNIATLESRLQDTEESIEKQLERARKVSIFEAKLQELTRDYDVNNESYTDLMRRREQARVSMNIDVEGKGLSLRIDEPAYRPHNPSGIRFLHFLIAGPVVGITVPVGLILLNLMFNSRIRGSRDISNNIGIPVLGTIPHLSTPVERSKELVSSLISGLVFLGSIAFILNIIMKTQGKY